MSTTKEYYVIAGYDLTGFKTDKFDDWLDTDDGEEYTCNQIKGEIQLFYDPMGGDHLYFGYILAAGDQYSFDTTKFSVKAVQTNSLYVVLKLNQLTDLGIISKEVYSNSTYQMIAFEECR